LSWLFPPFSPSFTVLKIFRYTSVNEIPFFGPNRLPYDPVFAIIVCIPGLPPVQPASVMSFSYYYLHSRVPCVTFCCLFFDFFLPLVDPLPFDTKLSVSAFPRCVFSELVRFPHSFPCFYAFPLAKSFSFLTSPQFVLSGQPMLLWDYAPRGCPAQWVSLQMVEPVHLMASGSFGFLANSSVTPLLTRLRLAGLPRCFFPLQEMCSRYDSSVMRRFLLLAQTNTPCLGCLSFRLPFFTKLSRAPCQVFAAPFPHTTIP